MKGGGTRKQTSISYIKCTERSSVLLALQNSGDLMRFSIQMDGLLDHHPPPALPSISPIRFDTIACLSHSRSKALENVKSWVIQLPPLGWITTAVNRSISNLSAQRPSGWGRFERLYGGGGVGVQRLIPIEVNLWTELSQPESCSATLGTKWTRRGVRKGRTRVLGTRRT